MTKEQALQYLASMEAQLLNRDWLPVQCTKEWYRQFPAKAGVYIIKEGDQVCYIGESGNLRKRMRDLLDTRNHSLRRKIGARRLVDRPGFVMATASRKFPSLLEEELNELFMANLSVSAITVELGRKELEEYLVAKYELLYNSRGKRG